MLRTRLIILFSLIFIFTSFGCESFRKKFVRKPKKEKDKEEEMIIYPKDYSKQQLPSDEAYKQYYTYWKAWHNELISFLKEGESKKKILSCFEQTILNLNRMKELLNREEKIKLLEDYIAKVSSLEAEVRNKRLVMVSMSHLRTQSERLLRSIHRDFAFSKVKNDLK